jgi:hypothetical protein
MIQKIQPSGYGFGGAKAGGTLRAGSDADEVGFFSIDNLPDRMAFPTDLLVCQKLERCLDSDDFKQYLESCWAAD